eukprot:scaffold170102_cov49-Prasinocladus_malaysianus.AAC.2
MTLKLQIRVQMTKVHRQCVIVIDRQTDKQTEWDDGFDHSRPMNGTVPIVLHSQIESSHNQVTDQSQGVPLWGRRGGSYPVRVKHDDRVGGLQVEPQPSGPGGEHEEEVRGVLLVELGHIVAAVLRVGGPVQAHVQVAAHLQVVLQDVELAGHLAEEQHAVARRLELGQDVVQDEHLAAGADDLLGVDLESGRRAQWASRHTSDDCSSQWHIKILINETLSVRLVRPVLKEETPFVASLGVNAYALYHMCAWSRSKLTGKIRGINRPCGSNRSQLAQL